MTSRTEDEWMPREGICKWCDEPIFQLWDAPLGWKHAADNALGARARCRIAGQSETQNRRATPRPS